MPGQLTVIAGPDRGRAFTVSDGQKLLIGRGEASATKLRDPAVSRVHCHVEAAGSRYTIVNLGAASGTLVNGRRITSIVLESGDLIRIGDTELRFMVEGPAAEAVQGPPAAAAEPLAELVGTTLTHYKIDRRLARGSSGMIFHAWDTKEDRPVALKVLWPEFTRNDEEMQRFVRAMKTMLPIRHENLVALYGAGKTGPYCWIAMEYVEGESLTDVIHRIGTGGMLDWRNAFRVAVHIGRALELAHQHQIIHRNITPQNILVRSSDKVAKLGDLLLAKALEGTMAEQITRSGQLVGEVVYMSPERTHGSLDVDCRSDIYGLGATLYALLTGRPPFEGGSLGEAVNKIRNETPLRPKKYQLAIPDFFEDAVMRMLAKDPADRFQTPAEMLHQLERIAKFQARAVWEEATGSSSGAAGESFMPQPAEAAPAPPRKPAAPQRRATPKAPSRELLPDAPSTHLFRNILAGLLDEAQAEPDAPRREPLTELVGRTLYQYEIKRILAKGQTSMVFLAQRVGKDLPVALKVLWPELAQREDEVQRFVRAVKTMLPIHHPNIVELYDAGRTDGYCWMAMEYVKGASLTKVIDRIGIGNGMLDWRDALSVAIHIGRALEEAFRHQIIHRNITPQNVLIRLHDHLAKLGDLTLAKAFEGRLAEHITAQGQLVGSLMYTSPERTQTDQPVDQRSDIYSLGATVYALLTGRPPLEGRALADLVSKIRKTPPLSPRQFQADIPELLERVVLKMLAKQPSDRYATPTELLADLERIAAAEGLSV
jgi:serine/threonine protein kinase